VEKPELKADETEDRWEERSSLPTNAA
jgi:hypothetical protein